MINEETIKEMLFWKEYYKMLEKELAENWAKEIKENDNTKLWNKFRRKK